MSFPLVGNSKIHLAIENALKELEKRIRKEKRQHQSNKPQLSTTQKDFKSKLIDEFYSDLSTKHV